MTVRGKIVARNNLNLRSVGTEDSATDLTVRCRLSDRFGADSGFI